MIESDGSAAVLGTLGVLCVSAVGLPVTAWRAAQQHSVLTAEAQRSPRSSRGIARVRRVRAGFADETEMCHFGTSPAGGGAAARCGRGNIGGISGAALQQLDRGREPRNAWRSGLERRRPPEKERKWAGCQARGAAIFRARSRGPERMAGFSGAPNRQFPALFRFSERSFANFRVLFRFSGAFPEPLRRRPMSPDGT